MKTPLSGSKILLGVCGSIAAYKSALLIRLMVKSGAEVKVVMTPSAVDFITPLTLATLSKKPVHVKPFDPVTGEWVNHVELGMWADLMVIAPASANTIARMATGQADNLLLTTYLSAKCPVYISPAMDLDMYRHPATTSNMKTLMQFGNHIVEARFGELASGLEGHGRMAEPEEILKALEAGIKKKSSKSPLSGKRILLTAGPTQEALDPVRYITNHSTGKMGYAIANELLKRGSNVTIISGPVQVKAEAGIEVITVKSAMEMHAAALEQFKKSDIGIMAAAVADYRPASKETKKIKKKGEDMVLTLLKNPDIAGSLGRTKKPGQVLVGFALETDNALSNAKEKLEKKNLDFIVLNTLEDDKSGFGYDTNQVTIINRDNKTTRYELKSKDEVALDIADYLEQYVR